MPRLCPSNPCAYGDTKFNFSFQVCINPFCHFRFQRLYVPVLVDVRIIVLKVMEQTDKKTGVYLVARTT